MLQIILHIFIIQMLGLLSNDKQIIQIRNSN